MGTDKFKKQIQKNKEMRTSTDEVTAALYEETERNLSAARLSPESGPLETPTASVFVPAKKSVGRPKGDDTVRKTVYIPDHMWPYVQAATKIHGGNLQKYINDLLMADINKNKVQYKELAELYKSINEK